MADAKPAEKSGKKKSSRSRKPSAKVLYAQFARNSKDTVFQPGGTPAVPEVVGADFLVSKNQSGASNGANVVLFFGEEKDEKRNKDGEIVQQHVPGVFMSMPISVLGDLPEGQGLGIFGSIKEAEEAGATNIRWSHLHSQPNMPLSTKPGAKTFVPLVSIRVGKPGNRESTYLLSNVPAQGRVEALFTDWTSQFTDEHVEAFRKIGVIYRRQSRQPGGAMVEMDYLAIDMGAVDQGLHVFGRVGDDGALSVDYEGTWWSTSPNNAQVDTPAGSSKFRGGPGEGQRARSIVSALWKAAQDVKCSDGKTLAQHISEFRGTPQAARGVGSQMGFQAPGQSGGRPGRAAFQAPTGAQRQGSVPRNVRF